MTVEETKEKLEKLVHDLIVLLKTGKFDRSALIFLNKIAKTVAKDTEALLRKET
jgi:hypothetical protein